MESIKNIFKSLTSCAAPKAEPMEVEEDMMPLLRNKDTIIYCRVSTQTQDLEAQLHACKEYCSKFKLNVIAIVTEKCSAYKSQQSKLLDIITKNNNINIVIYSVDRFSRNTQTCDDFIDLMQQNQIDLKCVKEYINIDTAYGKHNFRQMVSAAQYESELIGERVKNNIKYKRDNNIHIGKAPFGYFINDNRVLQKNNEEQAIIKFILRSVNAKYTLTQWTDIMYTLLTELDRPQSDFVPIEIIEEDDKYTYHVYAADEKVVIKKSLIVEILNDYNILNRTRKWTLHGLTKIVNSSTKTLKDFGKLTI
jgi:DNA invertase Pin-like site-specific DNA recombinase